MSDLQKLYDGLEMRGAFVRALSELMKANRDIIALDADLASASGFNKLFREFPEQCVNAGISEANMVGVAAGMSLAGKVPFVHSFAPFLTRRALDQLFMSCAYQRANVKFFGSEPGYWAAHNGGTHTSIEDIAILRAIPELRIFAPSDAVQMDWVLREAAANHGVYYIRSPRKMLPRLYEVGKTFTAGQPEIVREGGDLVIFACGAEVHEALKAAEKLAARGIEASVVDVFCLKPLQPAVLLPYMSGKKLAVTAENHSKYGGLGSILAEIIAEEQLPLPLRRVAIPDRFGEVGSVEVLRRKYEVDSENIVEAVEAVLEAR